eukprot:m.53001 g.53001  ORF g.53001 m.53001 type:complete len:63 (-) comp11346_c0_seq1:1757-1945(-)
MHSLTRLLIQTRRSESHWLCSHLISQAKARLVTFISIQFVDRLFTVQVGSLRNNPGQWHVCP